MMRAARQQQQQQQQQQNFMRLCRSLLAITLLGVAIESGAADALPAAGAAHCRADSRPFARVELLFGAARSDGTPIAESEWQTFLADEVTPRFPDGLTVFEGQGQWRGANGAIERSPSRVLLIWYAPSARADADIEAIRGAYKARFVQESVMRVDGQDCVSF